MTSTIPEYSVKTAPAPQQNYDIQFYESWFDEVDAEEVYRNFTEKIWKRYDEYYGMGCMISRTILVDSNTGKIIKPFRLFKSPNSEEYYKNQGRWRYIAYFVIKHENSIISTLSHRYIQENYIRAYKGRNEHPANPYKWEKDIEFRERQYYMDTYTEGTPYGYNIVFHPDWKTTISHFTSVQEEINKCFVDNDPKKELKSELPWHTSNEYFNWIDKVQKGFIEQCNLIVDIFQAYWNNPCCCVYEWNYGYLEQAFFYNTYDGFINIVDGDNDWRNYYMDGLVWNYDTYLSRIFNAWKDRIITFLENEGVELPSEYNRKLYIISYGYMNNSSETLFEYYKADFKRFMSYCFLRYTGGGTGYISGEITFGWRQDTSTGLTDYDGNIIPYEYYLEYIRELLIVHNALFFITEVKPSIYAQKDAQTIFDLLNFNNEMLTESVEQVIRVMNQASEELVGEQGTFTFEDDLICLRPQSDSENRYDYSEVNNYKQLMPTIQSIREMIRKNNEKNKYIVFIMQSERGTFFTLMSGTTSPSESEQPKISEFFVTEDGRICVIHNTKPEEPIDWTIDKYYTTSMYCMNLNNLSVTYETEKGDLLEPHSGTVDLIGYIEVTFQSLN